MEVLEGADGHYHHMVVGLGGEDLAIRTTSSLVSPSPCVPPEGGKVVSIPARW